MPSMEHGWQRQLTVLGRLVLSREDDGTPWPFGVQEGVAILLELVLSE